MSDITVLEFFIIAFEMLIVMVVIRWLKIDDKIIELIEDFVKRNKK